MSGPAPRHKSTARTFRLGDQAEGHIAAIVAHLAALTGAPATDTAAIRYALAECAKMVAKNNSRKTAG